MANSAEIQSFINSMITQAQKGNSDYGVLASVTIAQGAWESGWGLSPLAQNDNNLFGIKFAGNHDTSISVTQGTQPSDGTGGYYCHYNSWGDSSLDHGYFLKNNSRYSALFSETTPQGQLNAIWQAGYAQEADGSLTVGYVENIMSIITANNLTQYDTGSSGGGDADAAAKIESAVTWLINIANDETHGYDQDNRWSPDYDCSSFVISGYEQAGVPLKTNGATYTGDMKDVALNTGFTVVDWGNDTSKLLRGDILLNETHHVCCYIGNGQIVQASINELGTVRGGQTGDQTGKEIYVRDYYTYSHGWDCVLRYGKGSTGGGTGGGTGGTGGVPSDDKFGDDYFEKYESYFNEYDDLSEVYKKLKTTPYIMPQLSSEQVLFLRTLNFFDKVHMKFTFDHNKRYIGKNFVGKKLTFDNKEYILKDVKSDGLTVLTYGGSLCYNYLNPKYIYQNDTEKQQTKSINVGKIKAHIQDEIEQALKDKEVTT